MFTVRLVGGNSSHEGRLEVYHDGVWGSVCDHGFTETEVSVACRSLGFTYVSYVLTLCACVTIVASVSHIINCHLIQIFQMLSSSSILVRDEGIGLSVDGGSQYTYRGGQKLKWGHVT